MTVATRFYNWTSSGLQPGAPYTSLSPNLRIIRDHLLKRWGGIFLGGYNVRYIAGTQRWSAHAFGAAIDVSWAARVGGPGVEVMEREILPWLVDGSAELGIQVVHHYACWSSGPNKGKNRWTAERGWYTANIGKGDWCHIETHPDQWGNRVPIEQRLPIPGGLNVEFAPERGVWGLWPLWKEKPTISIGSVGDSVRYLQGVLKLKAGQSQIGPIDGIFGSATRTGVVNVQKFFLSGADGVVAKRTWDVIDFLAGVS